MALDPGDKTIHPHLQEGAVVRADIAVALKEPFLILQEDLWLAPEEMKSRHLGLGASLAWVWVRKTQKV